MLDTLASLPQSGAIRLSSPSDNRNLHNLHDPFQGLPLVKTALQQRLDVNFRRASVLNEDGESSGIWHGLNYQPFVPHDSLSVWCNHGTFSLK
ncbi:MAG: hypothetical protein JO370_15065 [Paucibacter sp.]|nr:hypothetical protein [Roseateles sp.]